MTSSAVQHHMAASVKVIWSIQRATPHILLLIHTLPILPPASASASASGTTTSPRMADHSAGPAAHAACFQAQGWGGGRSTCRLCETASVPSGTGPSTRRTPPHGGTGPGAERCVGLCCHGVGDPGGLPAPHPGFTGFAASGGTDPWSHHRTAGPAPQQCAAGPSTSFTRRDWPLNNAGPAPSIQLSSEFTILQVAAATAVACCLAVRGRDQALAPGPAPCLAHAMAPGHGDPVPCLSSPDVALPSRWYALWVCPHPSYMAASVSPTSPLFPRTHKLQSAFGQPGTSPNMMHYCA